MSAIVPSSTMKVVKVTAVGTSAVVILALQMVVFSAFVDALTSCMLFGIGYLAGRYLK